ncbi:MAG: hypothetical protein ACLVEU_19000 [Bacteroides cellulosilyticus]
MYHGSYIEHSKRIFFSLFIFGILDRISSNIATEADTAQPIWSGSTSSRLLILSLLLDRLRYELMIAWQHTIYCNPEFTDHKNSADADEKRCI